MSAATGFGGRVGDGVNPGRIAATTLERLRQAPSQPVATSAGGAWVRRLVVPLAAAAVLALAVWGGDAGNDVGSASALQVAALPELDDLDEAELESLFQEFAGTEDPTIRPLEAPQTLDDLTDTELESLLRIMEG